MFDLWAPEHSVLREKVIEHIFLAELSRTLLLDLKQPFEVLRAEFDANGYDVAIEAAGLLRHIQLKATAKGGKRANVDVQLALGEKPGGCVVWIYVNQENLELGPFLWFGDKQGGPLPTLGDREVKHSKGDAKGEKKVRSALRRLPKGEFTRFERIEELALAMFPPADHRQLLERHLARRTNLNRLAHVTQGLNWESSAPVAYMIDGYELAEKVGIEDPIAFLERKRSEAELSGRWSGTALELWLILFMEHRRDHFSGAIGTSVEHEPPMLDELCEALTRSLHSSLI